MTCFDEGTKNNYSERGDRYISDIELNTESTTLDFGGEVSSLTSMQNSLIIHMNKVKT